jgi:hypothetical protein
MIFWRAHRLVPADAQELQVIAFGFLFSSERFLSWLSLSGFM